MALMILSLEFKLWCMSDDTIECYNLKLFRVMSIQFSDLRIQKDRTVTNG